jgi:hypothetical protein
MADMNQGELELELEDEFHESAGEGEEEDEQEEEFGAIGNIIGGLLGEGEEELEDEGELEDEDELEDEEEFGAIGNILGGLLGEGEEELEDEDELEEESGEHFSFGSFFKKALPILKKVAKVAAPIVGGAILGPAGASLAKAATSSLEGEFEDEMEDETEGEGEDEMAHEIAAHPLTHNEAVAEMLADTACREANEGEAEAMVGAAAVTVISPRDRRALRRILPYLVRGTAILTRILRRRRRTRIGVKAVPTIMRRTVKSLKRQAAKGMKINRRRAARTAATQVRRVLGSPKACLAAIRRNTKVARRYNRPRRRMRARFSRRRRAAI